MQWTSREAFTLTTLQESSASTPTFMSVGHNSTEQIFQVQNNLIRNGGVGANPEVFNQVVIWALVDGFLFLAIVSGNALTIAAILMNRSIFHIVSNHFILSLTCSDLFVGLMLPYHMMFYVEPDLGQRFGFCITRLALIFLACSASVANIIGITVDRFLAIVYPLHYNKLMTKR